MFVLLSERTGRDVSALPLMQVIRPRRRQKSRICLPSPTAHISLNDGWHFHFWELMYDTWTTLNWVLIFYTESVVPMWELNSDSGRTSLREGGGVSEGATFQWAGPMRQVRAKLRQRSLTNEGKRIILQIFKMKILGKLLYYCKYWSL